MHAGKLNVQRGLHDTSEFEHDTFQGKHVKLSGELPSLREKLRSFVKKLPSLGGKLPRFAENMLARARTYIDFVRAPQVPAKIVSPIETCQQLYKEQICPESN
jgi:hypothetical protein